MEENKGKKSIELSVGTATCIIIIILLLVALIIMGMYTWFQKKEDADTGIAATAKNTENREETENLNSTNHTTQKEQNNSVAKPVELDLNSQFVQSLYQYVLKCDDSQGAYACQENIEKASFYKDTKTTYANLNNMEKVLTVLKNSDSANIKKVSKNEVKDLLKDTKNFNENYGIGNEIKVYENVEEVANQIFGTSADIDYVSYMGQAYALEYVNGNYYEFTFQGGGGGPFEFAYSDLQRAKQEGDYIYLYDTFLWINKTDYMINNGKVNYYTTSDETAKIDSKNTIELSKEKLMAQYQTQLNTYKHTFKKASNGSYYWISTEIEK